MKGGGEGCVNAEFAKEMSKPDGFFSSISDSNILSFGRQQYDQSLLLGSLADGTPSEHEDKARGQLLIVNVTGPISVNETIENGAIRCATLENEVKV